MTVSIAWTKLETFWLLVSAMLVAGAGFEPTTSGL